MISILNTYWNCLSQIYTELFHQAIVEFHLTRLSSSASVDPGQEDLAVWNKMSHVSRKPLYAICEQQRRRSAHLLTTLASWAGRFESLLVANPDDRFSCDGVKMSHVTRKLVFGVCYQVRLNPVLTFLLDNLFNRFGTKLYRQMVGIPMGTNCAPIVADLFLFLLWESFHDVSFWG